MDAFSVHRWPKDAKMDPKDGPRTSKMRPSGLGPVQWPRRVSGPKFEVPGVPRRGVSGQIGLKNIKKQYIF